MTTSRRHDETAAQDTAAQDTAAQDAAAQDAAAQDAAAADVRAAEPSAGDEEAASESKLRDLAHSIGLLPQAAGPDAENIPEGAVMLPVVEQDGTQFVPVFTSEEALRARRNIPTPRIHRAASDVPARVTAATPTPRNAIPTAATTN
jgi:hypothetical protein